MGRKRGLPARAREKLVAEEAASAMEVERKEAVLHGKPDDSLFVLDSAGVCCVCDPKGERVAAAAGSHVHHILLYVGSQSFLVRSSPRRGQPFGLVLSTAVFSSGFVDAVDALE